MRINFILPTANLSGGIRVVAIYAKALAELGHRVVLISQPPKLPSRMDQFKRWLRRQRPYAASGTHLDGLGLDHRVLDTQRPPTDADVPDADVIVATWWETAEWVANLSDSKGAKVYFVQGHEVHDHLPAERSAATYHLPLHKIVVAQWLKDVMRTRYKDQVVDVVGNSIDHRQFFAGPRGKQPRETVGFLYSPARLKGVDTALHAIAKLRIRFPNLRVIAFGSKWPEDRRLFDGENIEFTLSPPQGQIRELYAQCDVWLTASRSEGFNLPAMEAMACRTPVVSTRTGWPEAAIVDGQNGYLVDVDDAEAMADTAGRVLGLPDAEWRAMSERAFETVRESSWEQSARAFEQALLHACLRARRGEIAGTCSESLVLQG